MPPVDGWPMIGRSSTQRVLARPRPAPAARTAAGGGQRGVAEGGAQSHGASSSDSTCRPGGAVVVARLIPYSPVHHKPRRCAADGRRLAPSRGVPAMSDSPLPPLRRRPRPRPGARAACARRWPAPTTASCSSSAAAPRCWSSTTAASGPRASTPPRASACAPSAARRRATPIRPRSRARAARARPRPRASRWATAAAPSPRRPARPTASSTATRTRWTTRPSPLKVETLREIDAFARALDPRVVQVSRHPLRLAAGGRDPAARGRPRHRRAARCRGSTSRSSSRRTAGARAAATARAGATA